MRTADAVVVGGGIVGLATAWTLARARSGARVVVLEKEPDLALHQTGRNSGVIHSGIYYKPGSMKARTCLRGKELLESFCRERDVRFETCGKVVVATSEAELPQLAKIAERARANGVPNEEIGPERLRELALRDDPRRGPLRGRELRNQILDPARGTTSRQDDQTLFGRHRTVRNSLDPSQNRGTEKQPFPAQEDALDDTHRVAKD